MAFDITDIAGLRRSPTQAGFAARSRAQNVFPYRPGASPVPETPPTVPAAPRKTRNQTAWEAVQLNPNRGTLPPELSTGSRVLDDELFRAARRMSGMANSRAAVEELKRKQWLTGERTLADEMPGATAPDYAGAMAPEKQVGPPDNGVWTAPDGTRYAMRDGVPVGRSGTAGGQWSMEQGNVGEFTGGSDRATRRNILRDEILGKMAETVGPPAPSRNVIPAAPAAPAPVAQAPRQTLPAALQPTANTVTTKPGEPLPVSLVKDTLKKKGSEQAYAQAVESGLVDAQTQRIIAAEIAGEQVPYVEALEAEKEKQANLLANIAKEDEKLQSGFASPFEFGRGDGTKPPPPSFLAKTRKISDKERGEIAKRLQSLQAALAESKKRQEALFKEAAASRVSLLEKALSKLLP